MNGVQHGNPPTLAVVVPCYNEEEILEHTIGVLLSVCRALEERNKISFESKLYFVEDGSLDGSWHILERAAAAHPRIVAIKLSRNRGHQNALYAGLCQTREDMVVSMDADLQDGAEHVEALVDEFLRGHDVVYGVRARRDSDTWLKRLSAESFYRMMRALGVDLVFNHADFRLLSRRAVDALLQYPEVNLFLRGLVRELGFPSATVPYPRAARTAGRSKYPLRRMLSFAWRGVTAFSTAPLRAITVLGALSSAISLALIAWVLTVRLFSNNAVPGWASILVPLLFIGSVQLLCLGVIGEYLGKLYQEVKRRPRFHVEALAQNEMRAQGQAASAPLQSRVPAEH